MLLSDEELEQCGLPMRNRDDSIEDDLKLIEKALHSGILSRMEQWLSTRIYAPSVRTSQFEFLSRRSAWEIETLQLMLLDKNGKPEKAAWLKHPKLQ
ncbi:Oidioi.mRNA.OKI2018_I69.XSR.g16152.t1.cds [Oikopleura dioica]|uniref:Oidioi.mRNA.OKI2018_I69.XSR.g16152.t1.cds n=1 Tax=Oikopleura dioica TaxID=34765 RepID=A0ABN7SF66_OIKDI|nr:Oidioi.mRNA.OKI2018_I69.XSR.g16152.t1.cds [Oikopleura dioica]